MGVLTLEGKFAKQDATLQKNVWVSERTLSDAFSIGTRPKGDQVHDVQEELHVLLPQAPLPHLWQRLLQRVHLGAQHRLF